LIYQIFIEKSAQKSLSKIPSPHQGHIINKISKLSAQPRPIGAMKLSGREAWRIRVGSYRVIYEINDDKLTILVVTLGHRKDIYRHR